MFLACVHEAIAPIKSGSALRASTNERKRVESTDLTINTAITSVTARTQPHHAFARQLNPFSSSGEAPSAVASLSLGIGGGARLSGGMAGDGAEPLPLRSTAPISNVPASKRAASGALLMAVLSIPASPSTALFG
jgi:hypothetical protein